MWVAGRIAVSLLFFLGAVWALLPGGFGVVNFRDSHAGPVRALALLCWWLLLLAHPMAAYLTWTDGSIYLWLPLVAALHVAFFAVFGRDLSADGHR